MEIIWSDMALHQLDGILDYVEEHFGASVSRKTLDDINSKVGLVINSQGYSQCYSRRKNLRHLRNLRDFIQRPDRSQKICVHLCNLWDLFSEHTHS